MILFPLFPIVPLLPQITVIEHELLSSQEEVHEVMQALEELAVSYDTKDREIGTVFNDKLTLAQENERIQVRKDVVALGTWKNAFFWAPFVETATIKVLCSILCIYRILCFAAYP